MYSFNKESGWNQPYLVNAVNTNKPGLDFFFKKTQLPWIGTKDIDKYVQDRDLKKLEHAMVEDTYAHRWYCYWKDNVARTSIRRLIANIVGEGLKVGLLDNNQEAERVIEEWNNEINVRHETIEDFLRVALTDNFINAETLWRVFKNPHDELHKIDLQRVSMNNIKTEIHPTYGWRRFIQSAQIPKNRRTKNSFYRKDSIGLMEKQPVKVIIPDEAQTCFYLSLFDNPPVSSVLHYMVYKRWIAWFMRKFAEKFWAPFLIAYVGDPKNGYMPTTKSDKDDAINFAVQNLKRIRNYGVAAFMATMEIETLDTETAKNAGIYVDYLEHLNKQILLGLYTSIALREGERQRAENATQVAQGQIRFIRGIRNDIGVKLSKLYAKVVLPAYGYEEYEAADIKIQFPRLQVNNVKDILESIQIGATTGVFKDIKEVRKILTPIWKHIDENISEEDAKKMWNLMVEMNAPSRGETDQPQSRAKSSA